MSAEDNSTEFLIRIRRSISVARFDSYKKSGCSDLSAFSTYLWNIQLCESLYTGFQILEVAYRNAVHREIGNALKCYDWLSAEPGFLYDSELQDIRDAKKEIQKIRSLPVTEPFLVAEMSFGFWTSLLDSRYDRMWPKIISGVFPNMPRTDRTRRDVSSLMQPVRKMRNKAMHHHSIWHWADISNQHSKMMMLIAYICSNSAKMAAVLDRFPKIYSNGKAECERIALSLAG